jgi:hypothetical protein
MHAALVAAIAEVDLHRVDDAAAQGGKIGADEQRKGGVHERVLEELPSLTIGDP